MLACGALAGDLRAVLAADGLASRVDIDFLPANLHNRPDAIAPALRPMLQAAVESGRPVFVAYADCGTGGGLDALLLEFPGVQRLPGAHCYEVLAGSQLFASLHEEELGTFYVTDFLARHFEALVWRGLGLDRHPELRNAYFGNYRRLVLLSQATDREVVTQAQAAAARLGLAFEHRPVGRGGLSEPLVAFVDRAQAQHAAAR